MYTSTGQMINKGAKRKENTMKILSLKLENFRSIKSAEFNFGGHDANIYGANGTGKTTVGNAICWLLIDRPMTEEANFDPKTIGEHNLHHQATIRLAIDDGQEMEFAKDFYEKWTKKRGRAAAEFAGHTTDYYIDGVPAKEKEYVKAIEAACGLSVNQMKPLMILSYFSETMKIDERRALLFEACGDVTDEEVIENTPELAELPKFLAIPGKSTAFYTTEQYLKIAKAQRAAINDRLKMIPARIDEAKKAMPELIKSESGTLADTQDSLRAAIAGKEKEKKLLLEQAQLESAGDGRKAAIQTAIAGLKAELQTKRAEFLEAANAAKEAYDKEIGALRASKNEIDAKIFNMEEERRKTISLRDRLHHERVSLLAEYEKVHARQWDQQEEVCPTCGRELPADTVQELRAKFNRTKAEELAAINEKGQACSQAKIQELEARMIVLSDEHSKLLAEADALNAKINARPKGQIETPAKFEDTEEYAEINQRIEKLAAEKEATDATNDEVNRARNEQVETIETQIASLHTKIAEIQAAERTRERIAELQDELMKAGAEMETVEHGIHLCEELTRAKVRMVEDNINGRFSGIRFQLFKDQINGGLKETCDIMMPSPSGAWVEYKAANTAAQVNGSLEVIDFLNRHYGVSLPVVMDKAEGVTSPILTGEQFIRLIVSAGDKQLRVEQI